MKENTDVKPLSFKEKLDERVVPKNFIVLGYSIPTIKPNETMSTINTNSASTDSNNIWIQQIYENSVLDSPK